MVNIAPSIRETIFGIPHVDGYHCVEYPRFAVATGGMNTFYVIYKLSTSFDLIDGPFQGFDTAWHKLRTFLEKMEDNDELYLRLLEEGL